MQQQLCIRRLKRRASCNCIQDALDAGWHIGSCQRHSTKAMKCPAAIGARCRCGACPPLLEGLARLNAGLRCPLGAGATGFRSLCGCCGCLLKICALLVHELQQLPAAKQLLPPLARFVEQALAPLDPLALFYLDAMPAMPGMCGTMSAVLSGTI